MVDDGPLGVESEAGDWLLAIESATPTASVAVLRGGALVAEHASAGRGNHAETLLAMVDAVLSQAGVRVADLAGYAVSIGPGSFTSLRVGLATVKGLAFAGDARVAGVSTLAALAWQAHGEQGGQRGGEVAAALDARRGEVYGGVYRCLPGPSASVEVLCADALFSPQAFAEVLPARGPVAGSGAELHAEALAAAAGRSLDLRRGIGPTAAAVGTLGAAMLARGEGALAAELVPRYLRRAEAEDSRLAREAAVARSPGPVGPRS